MYVEGVQGAGGRYGDGAERAGEHVVHDVACAAQFFMLGVQGGDLGGHVAGMALVGGDVEDGFDGALDVDHGGGETHCAGEARGRVGDGVGLIFGGGFGMEGGCVCSVLEQGSGGVRVVLRFGGSNRYDSWD